MYILRAPWTIHIPYKIASLIMEKVTMDKINLCKKPVEPKMFRHIHKT